MVGIPLFIAMSFTAGLIAAEEVRDIPADPGKGFHWPYFLVVTRRQIPAFFEQLRMVGKR